MKKFSVLLTLAAFIIGGTIFHSCQKEETQQTPEKKVVNVLKGGIANVIGWNDPVYVDVEHEFCLYFDQDYTGGGNLKETNVQIQVELEPGVWTQLISGKGNTSYCGNYTFNEVGIFNIRYMIGSGGFIDGLAVTVLNPCVYSFTGELECTDFERTATFTYTSEVAGYLVIQGGLTNGAINVSGLDFFNANSNASVGGWALNVNACEEIERTVSWVYFKENNQGRQYEDGHAIDVWTAKLYSNETMNELILEMVVEPMFCN